MDKQTNVTVKVVTLTKQLVDSLLACNTTNRKIRKKVIDSYKRDMQAGRWNLTHQGIALSSDNVLIDGQHRLMAARECGYPPIQAILVTGLPFETQKYVDQQAKRTMRDVLKVTLGLSFSASAPAIANTIINSANRRPGFIGGYVTPTSDEIVEKVDEYFDEIEAICNANTDRFFAASYLAAFVVCAKESGRLDDVVSFMESIIRGEMLNREMPAFHLRNYAINSKGVYAGLGPRTERYDKTIKATNAFLKGEKMKVLRLP